MEIYPANLLEFERMFATEAACRDYLVRLRWPEGFSRPACGHGKAWVTITWTYYLDEFTFRFNRRTSRSRGKLFYRLVQQAVQVEPVTCNDIVTVPASQSVSSANH